MEASKEQAPSGQAVPGVGATGKLYRPHNKVPVSGVYNIVDEQGNYLNSQITCHAGKYFPATANPSVGKAVEHFREAGAGKQGPPFGYRLVFEALHLYPPPEDENPPPGDEDHAIHEPGDPVRVSGVYNVVALEGEGYLRHQRTCIKGEKFPPTVGPDPHAYGYVLEYRADHLSDR